MRSAQASSCAIIDPDDGTQVTTISGATVKAASCTVADALTKVVMLAGPEAGAVLDHYEASAMVVMASGEVWVTADWQDIKLCAT